tara:strand:- start:1811 stop:2944 length:1134 start_codon:yes stop_codon:yes gene_type:complete
MKVFISSVISGYEHFRNAVEAGIRSLGHEVIRAEDFPAADTSSRIACLGGVRQADLVVLLLGERYGTPLPPADVAPTHEEFLEAKGSKPILVFVQDGVDHEPAQRSFIDSVESWDEGRHRRTFDSADSLRSEVTRSIHQYELSLATTPIDLKGLYERAIILSSSTPEVRGRALNGQLTVALAGGPETQILRPRELESEQLEAEISQLLLFDQNAIFDRALGTKSHRSGGFLYFVQDDGRQFGVSEQGDIKFTLGMVHSYDGIPCVIVEDVEQLTANCLLLASKVLQLIDSANRLSRFVIAAHASGMEYFAWRSRKDHQANPNSVTHSAFFGANESQPVTLSPADVPRAAIAYDAKLMAEDITALLQREASGEGRRFS